MTERCDLQDHILPYILDERHVEDTLFIVVEEDFRFFEKEDGEPIAPRPEANSLATIYAVNFGATNCRQITLGSGDDAEAGQTPCTLADEGTGYRAQKVSSLKQLRSALLRNQSGQSKHGGVERREPIASS